MQEIVFLSHRIPYPPNKGDKIRSWHVLRHLSDRYRVHLGCFVDAPEDRQYEQILRERCGECLFLRLDPRLAKLRALSGLLTGQPLTLSFYRDRRLAGWLARLLRERPIDGLFVFSSAMAAYALSDACGRLRRIVDMGDVDSDKWRQYAGRSRWPASAIYAREGRTLLGFERRIARAFAASIFVSPPEAALFRAQAPESADRIFHVNTGVDHEYFSPFRTYANPYPVGALPIVFTGAMDYRPNVDAVTWFAHEVLPRAMQRLPGLQFFIVGMNPTPQVRRLAAPARVVVTGRVPDIRPFLAHAAAVVAPLRIARGVQNKVLEAMAMARAVVATPQALEGIDAEPGRHLRTAADPVAFADAVACAVTDENRTMGWRARERVVRYYDWAASFARLEAILEGAPLPGPGENAGRADREAVS